MAEKSNRESQIQAQDCSKDCNLILQMVEMVLLYPTDIYSMAPTSSLSELEKSTSKALYKAFVQLYKPCTNFSLVIDRENSGGFSGTMGHTSSFVLLL